MDSYKKQDCGDKVDFRDTPPKVWPDGSAKDANFAAIAPKQMNIASGHDTYQGIPGDGIVGGNPGRDHNTPAAWSASIKYVKGNAGVTALGEGGGGGGGGE